MSLLHKILDRCNVLLVTFTDGEKYAMELFRCRYRKGTAECGDSEQVGELGEIRKDLSRFPVIVLVCGYGVITKDAAAGDVIEKVRTDNSGFLWSESEGRISFVREQQVAALRESLRLVKAKVVAQRCIRAEKDAAIQKDIIEQIVSRYFREVLKPVIVLKPSQTGSTLAHLTASRLKLPVLGVILLALMANTLQSSKVQGRHQTARAELEAVRKTAGQTDETSRRRQEFLAEYDSSLARRISLMCDRAAMVVPESVILTTLSVQPPTRSLENNKKTVFDRERMVISGESPSSGPVSDYVAALTRLDFGSHVHLTSVEQDRDRDVFVFKITVEL